MRIVIKPEHFWGILNSKEDFTRMHLTEDNLHINALAKYNAGMFLVLKPKSKVNSIILRYKIHFPVKVGVVDQVKANIQKAALYTQIKVDEKWRSVDSQSLFLKVLGSSTLNVSDKLLVIQHNVSYYPDISEIQICLPSLGYLRYLDIQMDCDFIVKKPPKLSTIFLGSSLGTFNFVSAQSAMPCYLYRQYGINTCTVAVPKAHSFKCPQLMTKLFKNYSKAEKIVVDLENLQEIDNEQSLKYLEKLEAYIFKPSIVHHNVDKLIKLGNIKNVLDADSSMCCDWGHPNSYGIISYADWLIENGKLKKKKEEEIKK